MSGTASKPPLEIIFQIADGYPNIRSSRAGVPIPGNIEALMRDALPEFKVRLLHEAKSHDVWFVIEIDASMLLQAVLPRAVLIQFLESESTRRLRAAGTLRLLNTLPQSLSVLPWFAAAKNEDGSLKVASGRIFTEALGATA